MTACMQTTDRVCRERHTKTPALPAEHRTLCRPQSRQPGYWGGPFQYLMEMTSPTFTHQSPTETWDCPWTGYRCRPWAPSTRLLQGERAVEDLALVWDPMKATVQGLIVR
jgi:hypothetical protein